MPGSRWILHRVPLAQAAAPALAPGEHPVQLIHSLSRARVPLPDLPTGTFFFDLWPVREVPAQGLWSAPYYDSFAPPIFQLNGAFVHGAAGITGVGNMVLEESLLNTTPAWHHYQNLPRAIAIEPAQRSDLSGNYISLLAPAVADYRHAILGSLARLACLPPGMLGAAEGLLIPQGSTALPELLPLLDLLPTLHIREVAPHETITVEKLTYPLSVTGESAYHPCVADIFAQLSLNLPPANKKFPRRFYIDRRASFIRPLRNESALITALAAQGYEPIRLEDYTIPDQIRLFRQATAIIAPHCSGLTNLGFARPGCLIIELHMDACVDWSFRHLAALNALKYDCVIGRTQNPWPELDANFNRTAWDISINHVIAAAAHAQTQSPARAA